MSTVSKRQTIGESIARLLGSAPPTDRAQKKNWSERLSRELAVHVAQGLRELKFRGVLPEPDPANPSRVAGHESRARTSKGIKKLDVNYSTPELGLALGVSIKTLNFRDEKSRRYTKNFTRIDNELRAEAMDYHERQPYAVMIGLVFLPLDSCTDGVARSATKPNPSSFAQSIRVFRNRAARVKPSDSPEKFERIFVACYGEAAGGDVPLWFFDVMTAPSRNTIPRDVDRRSFDEMLRQIREDFEARNGSPFAYADDD